MNERWQVIGIVWLVAVVSQAVGFLVYFLVQMPPIEALRWTLYWSPRCIIWSTVLAAIFVALWVIIDPQDPPGRGSGPSPAG